MTYTDSYVSDTGYKCRNIFHQNNRRLKTNQELLEIHTEYESSDILCTSEHNLTQIQYNSLGYPN